MKFKAGDRVRVVSNVEFEGATGTCIIDPLFDDGKEHISILFDNPEYNTYYNEELGFELSNECYAEEELEYIKIANTAIARKLYPNHNIVGNMLEIKQ